MGSGRTSRGFPPAPVLVLAVAVPLLSLLPVWHARRVTPPGSQFMGFRYLADDHLHYAALMEQAREGGSFLMRNPSTSEPQRGVFVLPYFWLVGRASKLLGLTVPDAWDLFRVVGGPLYILAFWWLTGAFFGDLRARVFATALFSVAGGLDWIVTLLRQTVAPGLGRLEQPFDFFWNWSTFGTMALPNWVCPALLLLVVARLLLEPGPPGWRAPLVAVLMPLIWFLHPYSGMVAYLAVGLIPVVPLVSAWGRLERPDWTVIRGHARLVAPALASFAVVAAYLGWARRDEVFRLNSAQGLSWTDNFSVWWYPLSYGLLLPLAWFGARSLARERGRAFDLTVAWAAAAFFLSVNPLYAGVKFQYLLFPPLALLAARGFYELKEQSAWFRERVVSGPGWVVLAALLCLNAPVSMVKDLSRAAETEDIYMPRGEVQAMEWLRTQPEGVVVSSYWSGARLPWLSHRTAFLSHWFMTIDVNRKNRLVATLFSPQVPTATKGLILSQTGARYLYAGRAEAAIGEVDPRLPLRRLYDMDGVAIYEVLAGQ